MARFNECGTPPPGREKITLFSNMKKNYRLLLAVTTLLLFWTSVHRPGGCFEYELVIKPYPTLQLYVGGGEEGAYNRKLHNGEFPKWLREGRYLTLAWGSWESGPKPWELFRYAAMAAVFFGWLFAAWRFLVLIRKITDKGNLAP